MRLSRCLDFELAKLVYGGGKFLEDGYVPEFSTDPAWMMVLMEEMLSRGYQITIHAVPHPFKEDTTYAVTIYLISLDDGIKTFCGKSDVLTFAFATASCEALTGGGGE